LVNKSNFAARDCFDAQNGIESATIKNNYLHGEFFML